MIEINISIIVRHRDAIPKELSRGRPPYSSRFYTKRNELDVSTPPADSSSRRLMALFHDARLSDSPCSAPHPVCWKGAEKLWGQCSVCDTMQVLGVT